MAVDEAGHDQFVLRILRYRCLRSDPVSERAIGAARLNPPLVDDYQSVGFIRVARFRIVQERIAMKAERGTAQGMAHGLSMPPGSVAMLGSRKAAVFDCCHIGAHRGLYCARSVHEIAHKAGFASW